MEIAIGIKSTTVNRPRWNMEIEASCATWGKIVW